MWQVSGSEAVREAVGYFESTNKLQAAIDELMSSGFDRADLSLLAAEHAVEEKLGHAYRKVTELEDDGQVPRCCYVSGESVGAAEGALIGAPLYVPALAAGGAVVASGGTIFAGAAAAGAAAGVVGSLLARYVGGEHAQRVEEQLKHGGLLLWVRTWDARDEARAIEILSKHSGHDVHVHELPAPA